MTQSLNTSNTASPIAIVLGAGQGTRMNSQLPKVAHLIYERPMLAWVVDALEKAAVQKIAVVASPHHLIVHELLHKLSDQKKHLQIRVAFQDTPLGTAHAVSSGLPTVKEFFLENPKNLVLVALGDTPAIQAQSITNLIAYHYKNKFDLTLLAFHAKDPTGYGRVLVDNDGISVKTIREHKECSPEEIQINLCNSGIMCASFEVFEKYLPQIKNENSKKEFYLTDLPLLLTREGRRIGAFIAKDEVEFSGVNTQDQLYQLEKFLSDHRS